MKTISLSKWTPDGFDDRYLMYRFKRSDSNHRNDEYLLVGKAKVLDVSNSRYVYLDPARDQAEAEPALNKLMQLVLP
jgi:hypothetical protein